MLTGSVLDYIESNCQSSSNNELNVQLTQEQRKEIINKTESEIDSGKMKHLECIASNLPVTTYKTYNILSKFLEESGVVYKVETSGIYIWDYFKKDFGKLVGYNFSSSTHTYYLYLL